MNISDTIITVDIIDPILCYFNNHITKINMVASALIYLYGIFFDNEKTLNDFLKTFIYIREDVEMLISLAQKFEKDNIWYKVPKDIMNKIFLMVSEPMLTLDNIIEDRDSLNDIFPTYGYNIEILPNPYHWKGYYLGFKLGEIEIPYRNDVEEFDTFHKSIYEKLRIEDTYNENREQYENNFKRIRHKLIKYLERLTDPDKLVVNGSNRIYEGDDLYYEITNTHINYEDFRAEDEDDHICFDFKPKFFKFKDDCDCCT